MAVRVLYFEQLRLKSALSGSSADVADGSFSQRIIGSSGVPSAAVSPRDNYASLRRENRELKLEISRMRVRLSELEKEHAVMKDGMRESKSGEHGRAFFSSLSKGIGKIGFFGPGNGKQHKQARKTQATDGKSHRRRQRRSSIAWKLQDEDCFRQRALYHIVDGGIWIFWEVVGVGFDEYTV